MSRTVSPIAAPIERFRFISSFYYPARGPRGPSHAANCIPRASRASRPAPGGGNGSAARPSGDSIDAANQRLCFCREFLGRCYLRPPPRKPPPKPACAKPKRPKPGWTKPKRPNPGRKKPPRKPQFQQPPNPTETPMGHPHPDGEPHPHPHPHGEPHPHPHGEPHPHPDGEPHPHPDGGPEAQLYGEYPLPD